MINKDNNSNKDYLYWLSVLAIFILIYAAALNIPFHSDDYSYFLQGLSVEKRIAHYLNWSGRLITDFTSSYLLNLFSYTAYTAINSLVFVLFLVLASFLPKAVFGEQYSAHSRAPILWLLFIVYWLANPNLGQTSFWIVGSANYLWPLMWASLYLYLLFSKLSSTKETKSKDTLLLLGIGFIAGMSNEALGISICLFSLLMFWLNRKKRMTVLPGLIGNITGFSALYFAPGNTARLMQPVFSSWHEKSLSAKVFEFILYKFPTGISRYWFAWLVLILIFAIARRFYWQAVPREAWQKWLPLIFTGLSLFSVLVFIHSPAMPARAVNSGLYFVLLAIAFLASYCTSVPSSNGSRWLVGLILVFACAFVPSYVFFYKATKSTKVQHHIHEKIIKKAKAKGLDQAEIPDWYFTKLLKSRDKFDLYKSGAMSRYYGINKIAWLPAYFDYSILERKEPIKVNLHLAGDLWLKEIYPYTEFGSSKDGLLLVFNHPLTDYAKEGDNVLYAHLYIKGETKFINADIPIDKVTKVGDLYYYRINLKSADFADLEKIRFGFYNTKTKLNSADFDLSVKNIF